MLLLSVKYIKFRINIKQRGQTSCINLGIVSRQKRTWKCGAVLDDPDAKLY